MAASPAFRRARRVVALFTRQARRVLVLTAGLALCSTLLAQAEATGFPVLLISMSPVGEPGNMQSDYASVAYGGDTMTDPYPWVVYSSLSTNLVDGQGGAETEGMIEGNGSPAAQQYDVFTYRPESNETLLVSRAHGDDGEDGESVLAAIGSQDRDLVVFQSSSTNLSSTEDLNDQTDIYLVNLNYLQGNAVLISANVSNLMGGNHHSGNTLENGLTWMISGGGYRQIADWHKPATVYRKLTDNGQKIFVVFESLATDLTQNATNGFKQIFLRDVDGETTSLLTMNQFGEQGNGDSWQPAVSTLAAQEGCKVVFVSNATNLADVNDDGLIDASDDTNNAPDIFMLDRCSPGYTTTLISRQWNCAGGACSPGEQSNGVSGFPSFSQDGRFIVFQSKADNLIPDMDGDGLLDDRNGVTDIFLYDMENTEERISLISVSSDVIGFVSEDDTAGVQGNLPSYTPVVVSNGTSGAKVAVFTSYATNLVDNDVNNSCNYVIENQPTLNCPDIFVHDFIQHQTWRVSLTQTGLETMGSSGWPTLSGNGRFVYFTSVARLRDEGELSSRRQIFVRDQGNPPGNPNVQPTSYNFPAVNISQEDFVAPTRTFRIAALADIRIDSLTTSPGSPFVITQDYCTDGGSPRWLLNGQDCSFEVTFNPTTSGSLADLVVIGLHDENPGMADRGPITIRVKGNASAMLYIPLVMSK